MNKVAVGLARANGSKHSILFWQRVFEGMIREDMADELGVGLRTYEEKEKGISEFKHSEVVYLADRYDITAKELYTWVTTKLTYKEFSAWLSQSKKE